MNLTDYQRKKGNLPSQDLGSIFVFSSDRNGVGPITEHLVWETYNSGRRIEPKPEAQIMGYKIKESPYRVSIAEDERVSCSLHLFTGFGDCWSGSTFASLDKEALEEARKKEEIRISEKY